MTAGGTALIAIAYNLPMMLLSAVLLLLLYTTFEERRNNRNHPFRDGFYYM